MNIEKIRQKRQKVKENLESDVRKSEGNKKKPRNLERLMRS
jgi:hypothetical protein